MQVSLDKGVNVQRCQKKPLIQLKISMNFNEESKHVCNLLSKMHLLKFEQLMPSKCVEPLDPILALQNIMHRRAAHVATLLELKIRAEIQQRQPKQSLKPGNEEHPGFGSQGWISSFLQFVKTNDTKLFYSAEDTDRRAREAMLHLESQRRALMMPGAETQATAF